MVGKPSPKLLAALIVVGAGLLVGAGAIGWAIGNKSSSSGTPVSQAPRGHVGGANLPVSGIGDAATGRMLFVSKHCSECHMYLGKGGTDAPPLDFMRGHLSATEIANMSGRIWDHLPFMLDAFKEEGIPVPSFKGNEMANLIAYLHSGVGGAPEVTGGGMEMGGGAMGPGEAGKRTFINAGCGGCHTFTPAGTEATVGPNLDRSLKGKDTAFVQESIIDPSKVIAKGYQAKVMPGSYGTTLSKKQLADLVAYLLQKK